MKISIAMATYNGGKYLQEQLDSFIQQTRHPDELVITDDVSKDETLAILKAFQEAAPFRVRIFENPENLGYAKNFEKAISICSGDIIFLSDQDDVWFSNKIDVMTEAMANNPDMMVGIHDTEITDDALRPTGLRKSKQVLNLGLSINSFITGCCTVFKADIKEIFIPVPVEYFVHDTWLHRLAILLDSRLFVDKILQYYRRYDNTTSNWIGSSKKKVGMLDLALSYAAKDPRYQCQRRLSALKLTRERLQTYRSHLQNRPNMLRRVKKALSNLEAEVAAVERRAKILGLSRKRRPESIIKMFFSGDYNYFSGWKSGVKDLMWK